MIVSYHVHTSLSDGRSSFREYINSALELGINELGFSDHYVLTSDKEYFVWSMDLDGLSSYVSEIKKLAEEFKGRINIKTGIEADFFPETANELKEKFSSYPLDYIIGSVHIVNGFPVDAVPEEWKKITEQKRDEVISTYWTRIKEMAECKFCDVVAHMDLTKKFAIQPSIDISEKISQALDAISASGLAFELNTSGAFYPAEEMYPSLSIIQGCFKRKIPVLISADAHRPSHLTRSFHEAEEMLKSSGYRERVYYSQRKRFLTEM